MTFSTVVHGGQRPHDLGNVRAHSEGDNRSSDASPTTRLPSKQDLAGGQAAWHRQITLKTGGLARAHWGRSGRVIEPLGKSKLTFIDGDEPGPKRLVRPRTSRLFMACPALFAVLAARRS